MLTLVAAATCAVATSPPDSAEVGVGNFPLGQLGPRREKVLEDRTEYHLEAAGDSRALAALTLRLDRAVDRSIPAASC